MIEKKMKLKCQLCVSCRGGMSHRVYDCISHHPLFTILLHCLFFHSLSLCLPSPFSSLLPSLSPIPSHFPHPAPPSSHSPQSKVFVHVNRLNSVNTIIPYEYSKFDFCPLPDNSADRDPSENLGQVLFGERLRASAYQVSHTHSCTVQDSGMCICTPLGVQQG